MIEIEKGSLTQLSETEKKLTEIGGLAEKFEKSISRAFASGITKGKNFSEILKSVASYFIQLSLQTALSPIQSGIGGLFQGLFKGFSSGDGATVKPFADGGVISSPGYFPMAGGWGLAGESGAEAILPLARSSDGALGVRTSGGRTPSVVVNISANDAESFRRSEAQISATIARAVARGSRGS